MMRMSAYIGALLGVALVLSPVAANAQSDPGPPEVAGLVVYASDYDVPETVERVQDALNDAGMVTLTLDHQANAESVGATLRPTTVVIGGAPPVGTPLLLQAQEVGIDLPQKFLSWEDEAGQVWLAHNSGEYLAVQSGIDPESPAVTGLDQAVGGLATQASGASEPATLGAAVTAYPQYRLEQTSKTSVPESIRRYQDAFADAGLKELPVVDHQAGAESIGQTLRPTQVTFAGNPKAGTPFMAAQQTMGIDLPTRFYARESSDGTVTVGHVNIAVLAQRHSVTGIEEPLSMVTTATAAFTTAAAGEMTMPEGGVATGAGGTADSSNTGVIGLGLLAVLSASVLVVVFWRMRARTSA